MLSMPSSRCTFTYRDKRRCTSLCAPEHASLCPHHIRVLARDQGEIPPPLMPYLGSDLDNPWAVRRSIKRIFALFLEGKFSPEQLQGFAQLARLLLISTRRENRRRRRRLAASAKSG